MPRDVGPERVTRWAEVHDRIVALAKQRAAHERELCRWLLARSRICRSWTRRSRPARWRGRRCGSTLDSGGRTHDVDEAIAEMAGCDAQRLPGANPHVRARASQTIPPATRRAVLRRDHRRCVVPGCAHHRFLDVHHLEARAEGGGHDPERLAVLCGSHHRAVHAGSLCIDGTASSGFVFRHGDGTRYGEAPTPAALDAVHEVLGALEHMGFRPTRARALVDEALRAGAPRESNALLRAALMAT